MATANDDDLRKPITTTSRARRIEYLGRLIRREAPTSHKQQALLMILWEIPVTVQASLAQALVSDLLAEFASRHPKLQPMLTWLSGAANASTTLDDVATWRAILDGNTPTKADLFIFACAADIAEATAHTTPASAVTDAATNGVLAAIAAKTAKAWLENDPDGACDEARLLHDIRSGSLPGPRSSPLRAMSDDPVARKANLQAWEGALAFIHSRRMDAYPSVVDRKGLARCVRRARAEARSWF